MTLRADIRLSDFLNAVLNCRGAVCYETPEGDHLDLKSELSQFVFIVAAAHGIAGLTGRILCEESDRPLLLPYAGEDEA